MAEKVTTMVLKVVDLQCSWCYKKIKKILCKFPQIRDQVYDEKANTVTIAVVCCDPEKIRDKLCCKGHRVIKSIEIKDPPKPEEDPKTDPRKPETDGFLVLLPRYPVPTCCIQCYGGHDGGPCQRGYGFPPLPRPCFEGYYGCGCGYGRDYRDFNRCDYYLSEYNPSSCSVM